MKQTSIWLQCGCRVEFNLINDRDIHNIDIDILNNIGKLHTCFEHRSKKTS